MGGWRKSTYSGSNGGDCVEVADTAPVVLVRDTKNRDGVTLAVTAGFGVLAALFLVSPLQAAALSWWVMPLGFGIGQVVVGALIWKERNP